VLNALWKRARPLSAAQWLYVGAGGMGGALIGYGPTVSPLRWIAAGVVVAAGVLAYFVISASSGQSTKEVRSDPQ
jgi:hypothetical protein